MGAIIRTTQSARYEKNAEASRDNGDAVDLDSRDDHRWFGGSGGAECRLPGAFQCFPNASARRILPTTSSGSSGRTVDNGIPAD